jgi:hypothetical protein
MRAGSSKAEAESMGSVRTASFAGLGR